MTDLHRTILEFERVGGWRSIGFKESVVLELFGLSATRYAQLVQWIIDQPEALAYDAQTVNRLRRLRDRRKSARVDR